MIPRHRFIPDMIWGTDGAGLVPPHRSHDPKSGHPARDVGLRSAPATNPPCSPTASATHNVTEIDPPDGHHGDLAGGPRRYRVGLRRADLDQMHAE